MTQHGGSQESESVVLKSALNAFAQGILLFDHDGRLIYANTSAVELASQNDGFSLENGRIVLVPLEANEKLQGMIDRAGRRSFKGPQITNLSLSLARSSGKHPFSIVVRRLPAADHAGGKPQIMVSISDPSLFEHVNVLSLAELFHLSPAEAKLALALVETGTLQKAAQKCGLTQGSARQYVKHIFQKTRTRGQVELVSLILGSMPT